MESKEEIIKAIDDENVKDDFLDLPPLFDSYMEDDCQEIEELIAELDETTSEQVDQMSEEANRGHLEIEDFDLVNDEMDHSMDLIAIPIPECNVQMVEATSKLVTKQECTSQVAALKTLL
ncbi:hypothetical protein AAC387_Pa01g2821 [Persea americana]